ncbi:Arp2/3 complex 16 kDa subunit ARPC5 [Wilcoxina mikolae CBS 423.85]|nr:Arp2/3 complex 16 kDa subunit ARPC5 [Wilcoxina mikolae CBS 423.85]
MSQVNYRLIDVDAFDPDHSLPPEPLTPRFPTVALGNIQTVAAHCRQLLQSGDQEGALRSALENVPYGGDDQSKDLHLSTILDIVSSIKQFEMSPLLSQIYSSAAGTELLDVLMKYLYKGMARHSICIVVSPGVSTHATGVSCVSGQTGSTREFGVAHTKGDGGGMSVLLSWHEKVVEVAGTGAIVRVMTDRRTV